ncbi:sensor histidine kinase [Romboutsia lituseburensis]|uniref:histidine kinase n=1 Tax=Romboutsia lituseburensis DSM 797 TaxID=1121325 RepID=A0A1G9KN84_9FIRM|nr:HAMP domain-containing sensor histidine kinase [Romboutsia lituseburensis]CEH34979.1 Two-component sensor histidine kinase [Romboutsia lituseburensis]SDL51171.1 His Kinase A (phospho-acceptor) domain-containing protein [Romboutsia lituseburensis DSM 797]
MRRIFNKWENLNIKYKLFSITTGLLLVLAIIIYLILYFLLPSYYHKYKIGLLEDSIKSLTQESVNYSTAQLEERLFHLAKDQNLSVLLIDSNGRIVYGKNEFIVLKYSKYVINRNTKEFPITIPIYTKDSILPYKLNIVMPLQPIDEASDVIRTLMPYIIAVAILIAMLGAYIYSVVITKPLIDIIESEREAENRRKDFVATISHELKTPITIISGQLEGMIYNIGKYKDRDTYLKKSYESTQELKELVNEMIEVSKSEILEQDLILKDVNLSELLKKLVKRQQFLIDEKQLETILNIEESLYVKCDEERISKAINNIINNAIKYSPNGEKIIIRLSKNNLRGHKKRNNIRTYLEIENTGVNIDEKYLNEIFKPFFRVEKSRSRKTGGSGLGLYLVGQIFNSHGFRYSLKNKNNSVIFTVEL